MALALSLVAPPASGASASQPQTAPEATEASTPSSAEQGALVFGPDAVGTVRVVDPEGTPVATLTLRAQQTIRIELPVARYRIEDSSGSVIATVDVVAGQEQRVDVPAGMEREALPVVVPDARDQFQPQTTPAPKPLDSKPADAEPRPRKAKSHRWKRWAAPLFSALTPGVGQMVNRQPGKGVGVLLSTVTLGVAAIALAGSRDPREGAAAGDDGASAAEEVVTLGALSGITGALFLLYTGQVLDAHRVARGGPLEPRTKHKINVDVMRMSTVGFRPDEPAYAHYPDWTVSVMGQPVRRFSLGISDISFKWANVRDRFTVQAGLRLSYRVFDRKRLWLALAVGSLFQGSAMDSASDALDPDEADPEREGEFGAVPYGQFEMRIFVLDRWSLNLVPRMSIPATTRFYRGNRALPKAAVTFELGTGVGVYF